MIYAYYSHIDSNTQLDTSLPVNGLDIKMDMGMVRYAYSFPVAGKTGGVQFLLPYTWAEASFDSTLPVIGGLRFKKDGVGDITTVLAANLFGAPALTKEEFVKAAPETLLTAAVFITVPTGQYDGHDLVNFGGNRWVIKPQLAFNHPFGQSMISVNGNVAFYTENDNYRQSNGNGKLKQNLLGTLEAHYSYKFNRALWAGAGVVYSNGGETRINGVDQDNAQDTLKLSIGGSMNFSPVDAVAMSYLKTINTPDGAADVKLLSINYSHAW